MHFEMNLERCRKELPHIHGLHRKNYCSEKNIAKDNFTGSVRHERCQEIENSDQEKIDQKSQVKSRIKNLEIVIFLREFPEYYRFNSEVDDFRQDAYNGEETAEHAEIFNP